MSLTVQSIAETVELRIQQFGEDVDVLKYTTSVDGLYKQRAKTYSGTAITVRAMVALDPTPDMLSEIGHSGPAAGMLTIGRLHLESSFPSTLIEDTITVDDQLGVVARRWKVTSTHYTARMGGVYQILVVVFDHIEGRKNEVYP